MEEYYLQKKMSCDTSSGSDSDSSIESLQSKIMEDTLRKPVSKFTESNLKRNGVERLPTRLPDPKVYNRNALLARENRRKKKIHLETMETELEEAKVVNRGLLRMIKKQLKIVKKLEHEKSYYKSIITNQPEILSLLTALNSQLPKKSPTHLNSTPSFNKSPGSSLRRSSCSSTSYIYDQEQPLAINFDGASENGSVANNVVRQDAFLSPCPSASPETDSFFNNLFNDTFTDYEPSSSYDGSWNEILEECADISYAPVKGAGKPFETHGKDIPEDHNYVCKESKPIDDLGVCLHIGRNKVTLEFCPTCHWNASKPPSELLQTKDG